MAAHALGTRLGMPVTVASSLAEAGRYLDAAGSERVHVVTGLSLSDGHETEVVRFFAERGHPPIVVTGMFDEALRERVLAMPVVDYVLKDTPHCLDTLVSLVNRLERNRTITTLVVDDSKTARQHLAMLLKLARHHVLEAANGAEGLALINAHPDIRLVLTDFDMPQMDGIELTRRIRLIRPREELAIIGLSGSNSSSNKGSVSARFIKNGANDFLAKPYEREELDCRIQQNLDAQDAFARLRDIATKDYLTGLYNRRHFFEKASALFSHAKRPMAAMMDIDFFKGINDTYGHEAGDAVLKQVAAALAEAMRTDILLARFGGEEFCLMSNMDHGAAQAFFERLRAVIAGLVIRHGGTEIRTTASFGVAWGPADTLDALLARADEALYRAKAAGRNRVELATS